MLKSTFRELAERSAMVVSTLMAFAFLMNGLSALAQSAPNQRKTVPCPEVVTQTASETEGLTFECGTVSVPENYGEPTGRQITLTYGILRSVSLSPASDPIIYLHGGPGGGELASLTNSLAERLETLRARRDIVVFDQRGSGFSPGRIECNDVFAANHDASSKAAVEIAKASGMNVGAAATEFLIPLCADHLREQGVDLSQYNTINNARDVAALAKALGYESFNLYGHSYGTRLGLEVLRQDPDGLRAVLLDSVLPTDVAWRERLAETNEETFLAINEMCLAQAPCAQAYPDLVGTLNAVFASLDREPKTTRSGFPVTSRSLEQLILFSANQAGSQWRVRYLPRMIYELADDKTELFEDLFLLAYSDAETARPPRYKAKGVRYAARPLLNRANALATQSIDLAETADALARQALDISEDAADDAVSNFLRTLRQLEKAPYASALDTAYEVDRSSLPLQAPKLSSLYTFIKRHFQGADAEILDSIAGSLEDKDVEEIYRRLRNRDRYSNSLQELGFALRLFTCNDSIPFNSARRATESFGSYTMPGLTQREAKMMGYELSHCYTLPTGTLPKSFHESVTGDGSVPVMVFTGTNDIQTASSWAEQAADAIVGSQFVRFPNTGHGATLFSRCARDVAAAFFDQPASQVDASCKADLVPKFVLPQDPLPQ